MKLLTYAGLTYPGRLSVQIFLCLFIIIVTFTFFNLAKKKPKCSVNNELKLGLKNR